MPRDEDIVRLRHMLDAVRKAMEFAQGRSRADLDTDEMLNLALIRLLEVLGEAAKSVSSGCRQSYPEIPWKQIAGTRDRLIHGYFDVDMDIVWEIVTVDLPSLVVELEQIIPVLG
ncbi:MAG: DUF86 domain-containing protein [Chloroflexi bacterium]|nr:DUF86 domain-containing protein [Chloroflexota bacterium]